MPYWGVLSPWTARRLRGCRRSAALLQNVVKRLEAVIFKAWRIRLEDLASFDSPRNKSCWGSIGREVVRLHTGKVDFSNANNKDTAAVSYASPQSDIVLRMSAQRSSGSQVHEHLAERNMYKY